MRPLILLAEDDARHRRMLATVLAEWGYEVLEASNGREAIEQCATRAPDLALVDVRMPIKTGFEAIPELLALAPDLPIVLMTAFTDLEMAVQAMRQGAWDYVAKPLDMDKLKGTLNQALKQQNGQAAADDESADYPILGNSPPMLELKKLIHSVAPSEANVLITGESGTGKELAARAIHRQSKRKDKPFLAINCGAMSETLLASELFGHEKGAFTGADRRHEGIFIRAADGTLFLDEVGEMPLAMQVTLLRALQEKEILPVGGARPLPINCRIVTATNRDLAAEVARGNFREDLYYRLNVIALHLPPLRERKGDLPLLADHFARKFASANGRRFTGITPQAMTCLENWPWPGNVRELENALERAIILMPGEYIGQRELPQNIAGSHSRERAGDAQPVGAEKAEESERGAIPTLEQVERQVIMETLRRLNNNKTEAAKALGITRKTLHARLSRYREDDQ